ncbi:hypothetical protein PHYPSEUDO_009600 [Phytophthora pseudosyringae]|uniref:Uncharacterized protein n=1 Tax=Phytophthora pseudosyringae TaxID=221518 RepID=A0A8T1WJ02_9STRA|nr:hypothetical protein PHYPSEUDO_009600 [Phytophthora pseudosyringae]
MAPPQCRERLLNPVARRRHAEAKELLVYNEVTTRLRFTVDVVQELRREHEQKALRRHEQDNCKNGGRFLKFDGRMLKSFSTAVHLGFVCLRFTTPQAIPTARRADHFRFGRRPTHTLIDQVMRRFRLVYDEWLHRRQLLTKMATSSVLFGLGDRLAQRVEKIGKTDEELGGWRRTTSLKTIG